MAKQNETKLMLNDLYSKARRIYQKGYQVKELVTSLDMSVIRKKHADALADLEKALNVIAQQIMTSASFGGGRCLL